MKLLTIGNPKIAKGQARGYLSAVLHLAPADLSGRNVCQYSSAACRAVCLNTAGRGGTFRKGETTNAIQEARKARTRFFFEARLTFLAQLAEEIAAHVRRAARVRLIPTIRLNGTSDLPWERIRTADGRTIFETFPTVQFYDYTKVPGRACPANYHLTFSLSESNDVSASQALRAGLNVAVVFRTKAFPATYMGRPVVNGDETDLRFLDASGVIVGLSAKGRAKHDASGFVKDAAGAGA